MKQKENPKKRKPKKWLWICLIIFLLLAVGIAVLAKWQWNNIMALHYAISYSGEDLQKMQTENETLINEIYHQVSQVDLSRLPEEAKELLEKGELSEETAVAVLTGKITWEDYKMQKKPVGETAASSRVDDIIAQIYVLRSTYVGKLDSLVVQAWGEYRSGKISKSDLIAKYVGIGYSLEAECNGKIEGLLSELSKELSRTGEDMSLVDAVRRTYYSEKSIKKAEMIAKYQR